eukprot:TRINITY_DN4609_c0_g1_i1.p1 TRINITY_DN4609_c0_g1~~TRINITY_DN4609_c0_g1_i1.p1  ORF type:complete len:195 (-),score=30.76 TRINITY_DN4609_c0_g1_i1:150-662(-)
MSQIDHNKFCANIDKPATVRDLVFFLLSPALPPDAGATLFVSSPIPGKWQFLCGISNASPTAKGFILWNEEEAELLKRPEAVLQFGISIEPISNVMQLVQSNTQVRDNYQMFAKGVALEIYNYLSSFAKTTPQGELVVFEAKDIDRWFQKFQEKYTLDPDFIWKLLRRQA